MTGKTHRLGGMVCAMAGYSLLEYKGLLINDVDPLLQLTVIYPFALYGSVVSDLDHHWESTPCKDIVSWVINKILHITGAKHRSWHTHSDAFLVFLLAIGNLLLHFATSAESIIINLVFSGLLLGVISHMILDSLTPQGIHSVVLLLISKVITAITGKKNFPTKIRFVPKTPYFATDGPWEERVRKVLWLLCFLLLIRIAMSYLPYDIVFQ